MDAHAAAAAPEHNIHIYLRWRTFLVSERDSLCISGERNNLIAVRCRVNWGNPSIKTATLQPMKQITLRLCAVIYYFMRPREWEGNKQIMGKISLFATRSFIWVSSIFYFENIDGSWISAKVEKFCKIDEWYENGRSQSNTFSVLCHNCDFMKDLVLM
jgi:hypothetical protein